ncbi:biotin and thiamin synthesis associated [Caldicellulosiruptor acetigenus I77R1B]|uniref:Biotin and thiamin synthesis associated n=1 Tax=Caldicellulosiruptor acetigenus (strain ATCC 700853 / DSM 12137 / I77R1B) TaxID=632335 RepID=E4S688_CALA7|nr:biotin synthase BioB [Caldicellulosiruptor acetigenus]ADQ41646.1 biotin and thiamin synthesis associated [Caldicellulosiruptor acetigenus I77R1B]
MLNFLQSVQFVKEVEKKIIEYEKDIDFNEAIMLYEIAKHDADLVKNLANTIKQHYFENTIELCSIYPAKVGLCSEDCKFCSQSIHHSCSIEIKDLATLDEVIEYLENDRDFKNRKRDRASNCSGGIISIGEDMIERIKLAFELRELDVDSVPINILNPIKGTPFEDMMIISPNEIFITLALFRIILPKKTILLAGGKENALGNMEKIAYECGINGCMVGNYLTTKGMGIGEKIEMLESLGLKFQINMYNCN